MNRTTTSDASIDPAVERLASDGFAVLQERLDPTLVDRLLEVSSRSLVEAKRDLGTREIGIGSAEGYAEIVQRSPGRWDVPIDAEAFGLVDAEMPWWAPVASLLGEDAELGFSGVISSEPGSTDQYWHSDSPHEDAEHRAPNAINVLVALQDVPMEMGPTEFARGSHRLSNHLRNPSLVLDELVYQHEHTSPESLVQGTDAAVPEPWAEPSPAGSCVVFDDRVLHRGMANRSKRTRHVAYFTYQRAGYTTETYFASAKSLHEG